MENRNFTEVLGKICGIPSHRLAHMFDVPKEVAELIQEAILALMENDTLYITEKQQEYEKRVAEIFGRNDESKE
jgi:hypothetical protein